MVSRRIQKQRSHNFQNSGNYFEANDTTSAADKVSVARNYKFVLGWFNGCFRDGDYSPMLKETLGAMLPNFTRAEKDMIKGSCDFFAIDGYTSYLAPEVSGGVEACISNSSNPNFPECASSSSLAADPFPLGPAADNSVSWLYSTPLGIRRFLNVVTKELFPTVSDIMVTEFGFAEPFEGEQTSLGTILWDLRRADYYQSFLDNILAARVCDDKHASFQHPAPTPVFSYSVHLSCLNILALLTQQTGVNVTGALGWAILTTSNGSLGSRSNSVSSTTTPLRWDDNLRLVCFNF
jgi:hypothetical protein